MSATAEKHPIVVVGAGAAGLLAAIFAAGAGGRVVLLETTKDGGRKILISGGGRCNILPAKLEPARFVTTSSPNALRRILRSWPLEEQRRFFESEAGIPLAPEDENAKIFPVSNSARAVRDALVALATRRGVETRFASRVTDLERTKDARGRPGESFLVKLASDGSIAASAVVLATGGLSVPATGSDGAGLAMVRRLGHTIHETYPALTPLVAEPHPHAGLSGVSLRVRISAPGAGLVSEGGFLFTHRGYSGPAVLDLSHVAVRSRVSGGARQELLVQWTDLGFEAADRLLRTGRGLASTLLRRNLPDRLAEILLSEAEIPPERRLEELPRGERIRLVEILTRYPLPWTGDEGYRTAEVTGGGVALGEVKLHSMESRLAPGLFLCGEMLDAFGPIGGHNFAWAWASGRAAGLGAAQRIAANSA